MLLFRPLALSTTPMTAVFRTNGEGDFDYDKKLLGHIKAVQGGFQFFPKDGRPGRKFKTISQVKQNSKCKTQTMTAHVKHFT